MKKLLSIIFLSFFSMSAYADDQQTFVFNNLQGDFTTCYSYYLLSEEGFKKSGSANDETIAGLNKSADLSLESVYYFLSEICLPGVKNIIPFAYES
ncbi:hypothetical protein [Candidatus Pelagibacter sp.]|uniref:hypothetical protein n=1 Tax=Candidatus Pelagibacter sp. TaxID=2024849 RepID=UPI003D122E87